MDIVTEIEMCIIRGYIFMWTTCYIYFFTNYFQFIWIRFAMFE